MAGRTRSPLCEAIRYCCVRRAPGGWFCFPRRNFRLSCGCDARASVFLSWIQLDGCLADGHSLRLRLRLRPRRRHRHRRHATPRPGGGGLVGLRWVQRWSVHKTPSSRVKGKPFLTAEQRRLGHALQSFAVERQPHDHTSPYSHSCHLFAAEWHSIIVYVMLTKLYIPGEGLAKRSLGRTELHLWQQRGAGCTVCPPAIVSIFLLAWEIGSGSSGEEINAKQFAGTAEA